MIDRGKPCNIVFVTSTFDQTEVGPAVYARYLWNAFKDDSEFKFHVVAPEFCRKHPQFHPSGFNKYSIPFYKQLSYKALEIAEHLKKPVIIHCNSAYANAYLLNKGYPLIGQVNDLALTELKQRMWRVLTVQGPRRFIALLWRRRQEKLMVYNAELTICNSNYTKKSVLDNYNPINPDSVKTVYKAVSVSFFNRTESIRKVSLMCDEEEFKIVFIGMAWKIKGLIDLIDALYLCKFPWKLSVVGPNRPDDLCEIAEVISKRELNEKILLCGRMNREQIRDKLWDSNLFVLPSESEAFGVAILEAMAASVPVIVSRTGGIIEIINSPEIGITFEPRNVKELQKAIEVVYRNKELRQRLARNGPKSAERYSVEPMIKNVRELYHQVLGKSVSNI